MRRTLKLLLASACASGMALQGFAQTPEKIDTAVIDKIKEEGLNRSKVMETISYLTDVYGPRLTGAPKTKVAGDWAAKRLAEWGLKDSHLEPWGPFGRGWELQGCTVNLVEPNYAPLIAHVKAWSGSTPQTIKGEPIYLDVSSEEDLEKYRGKLGRAIVLIAPPREVKAHFEAPGTRLNEAKLLELANADVPGARPGGFRGQGGGPGGPGGGPTGAPGTAGAPPAGTTTTFTPAPAATNAQPPANSPRPEGRGAMQLTADKWQLCYDEGAAVVLDPGRGDGGTVFVASATMPRVADGGRTAERGNPFSRGPRPWAPEAPNILPQASLAAEHYNRLVRMIQKGAHPQLEIDIACRYSSDDLNSFNVIAEIPGTDLKDEIVMLGAHFDSWQSGTGATDNAVGCGVVMEAVRILQAIEAKPRRTIRIALWTGEEQGLLGSRAYVSEHFGKQQLPSRGEGGPRGDGGGRPRMAYELKAEHEKISAYYNLDNGTGKIRGIYLQGNEKCRSIFRTWLTPFNDMDARTITAGNTGGTDHQSFDGIGIPGFQFIQDEIEYDTRTHHSSMDVYERIQEDDVKQASIIMAAFVYNTAVRDEKIPRKPLEGEIIKAEVPATVFAPAVGVPPSPVPVGN